MDSICSSLNVKYACDGVGFGLWNNLPAALISNKLCDAVVTLDGAHVCQFTPKGRRPLLWMSGSSNFQAGKPLRGGIPVCWPWFGPVRQPGHGFARISTWQVESARAEADGSNTVSFSLESTPETLKAWPHKFKCVLTLRAGAKLDVSLKVFNTGDAPFSFTGALHTYIPVSKITDVKVSGLEGVEFTNALDGTKHVQKGPVEFGVEIDRLYFPTTSACVIEDAGWGRKVKVDRSGSRSAVVWNPWIEKSRRMPDFGDEEYWGMLCLESANAGGDVVAVEPGSSSSLGTVVSEI